MLRVLFLLLFTSHYINQVNSEVKILFVGHAYGDPNKRDQKLSPSLMKYLRSIQKTKIIYGGDFIQDCNDSTEVSNFKKYDLLKRVDKREMYYLDNRLLSTN